jgi:hypothetical protein
MTFLRWAVGVAFALGVGCGGKAVIDGEPGQGGGGASGVGGIGGGALAVELVTATVFASCGPGPVGDVDVEMTLELDNSLGTGAASFDFLNGELLGSDGTTQPFPITSESHVIVPGGASIEANFSSMSSGLPTACQFCFDTALQLSLHFDVDGGSVGITRPVSSISCSMF